MPFKKTDQWVNLAMRRMIRYAAENGFDRIAWTTGEQQAERYDLSKQVEKVNIYNQSDNFPNASENIYSLYLTYKEGKSNEFNNIPESKLPDYIGKELAERSVTDLKKDSQASYSGLDLKVGGEGMKAFYDQIVPKAANNLGKKFGSKIENINIPQLGETKSIPITESMKETALNEGMPMFRVATSQKELDDFVKDSKVKETVYHGTARQFKVQTPTVYHGSDQTIDKFDMSKATGSGKATRNKAGIFFTTDQAFAKSFGETLNERQLKFKKPLEEGNQDPIVQDILGKEFSGNIKQITEKKADLLKEAGYDGVIGWERWTDWSTGERKKSDAYLVFSEENIVEPEMADVKFRMIAQNPDFKKEYERYNGNNFEIKGDKLYTTLYNARFDTDDSGELLGSSINVNNAISDAESNPYDYDYTGASVSILADHLEIPIKEILDNIGDENFNTKDITEHEIDDFIKNQDTYKYTIGDDYYEYAKSEADNANTDDLIYDVQNQLSDRFNTNIGKYSTVYIDKEGNITGEPYDENDNENREISIRIADHTHNPQRGKPDVGVVIANKNATSKRFYNAYEDLEFDESNTADEIANEIEQFIKDNFSIDDIRFRIDKAASEVNIEPSEAQKEAGNYKMGHVNIDGFDISIENPKGAIRSGVNDDGEKWSNIMPADYGYIRGTVGKDKDHIDVFLGENPESDKVFVVDQVNPTTGEFDEHKILMGFDSQSEARKTYLEAYDEGWQGIGNITQTTKEGLKEWLKLGDTKKPFGPQVSDVKFRVSSTNPEVQKMLDRLNAIESVSKKREEELEAKKGTALIDEKKIIADQISTFKEGVQLGTKDSRTMIKEVQKTLTDYAKKTLPLTEAGARELGSLLTTIKNSQTPKAIESAFNKINELAGITMEGSERRKYVGKVNRLLKWMTGLKKQGTQKIGKFS